MIVIHVCSLITPFFKIDFSLLIFFLFVFLSILEIGYLLFHHFTSMLFHYIIVHVFDTCSVHWSMLLYICVCFLN